MNSNNKRASKSAYLDLMKTCVQIEEETVLTGIEVFNTSKIRLKRKTDDVYYLENVSLSTIITNINY